MPGGDRRSPLSISLSISLSIRLSIRLSGAVRTVG